MIGIDSIIIMLIVGAIAGWLAGQIVRAFGFGPLWNIILGIVGAFIGSWLLRQLGFLPFAGFVGSIVNATIGAVILLIIVGLIQPTKPEVKDSDIPVIDFGKRPSGWLGHWSARYGEVLVRTVNLYPPFRQTQSELLSDVPRPMHEALDPVASVAEPMGRDRKLAAWRLTRSTMFDLLGSIGIVIGVLALTVVTFSIAVPLLGLPPLMAPTEHLQPPKAPSSPTTGAPPKA